MTFDFLAVDLFWAITVLVGAWTIMSSLATAIHNDAWNSTDQKGYTLQIILMIITIFSGALAAGLGGK